MRRSMLLLAGLVSRCWLQSVVIRWIRYVAISAFIAILYAATDEFHQLFVPGRSGQSNRMCLIDGCGAVIGTLNYYGEFQESDCTE